MNLQVTYNQTTGVITFVNLDPATAGTLLQVYKFSYSGHTLLGEGDLNGQEVSVNLGEDAAYRLFVVEYDPETLTGATVSETYLQLHTVNSRQYIQNILLKYVTKSSWVEAVAVLRVILNEAQVEYSKGNLLGATQALEKIKTIYNNLNQ